MRATSNRVCAVSGYGGHRRHQYPFLYPYSSSQERGTAQSVVSRADRGERPHWHRRLDGSVYAKRMSARRALRSRRRALKWLPNSNFNFSQPHWRVSGDGDNLLRSSEALRLVMVPNRATGSADPVEETWHPLSRRRRRDRALLKQRLPLDLYSGPQCRAPKR
jgi:hypothetical protein